MKKTSLVLGLAGIMGLGFNSCQPEYDTPPIATAAEGSYITIDTLVKWYDENGGPYSITEEYHLLGVITTEESTGNFYKEAYFQDVSTRGIDLRFTATSGLYIGDSIRIALKGTYVDVYNNLMQLDSVDPDKNVYIQANNVPLTPLVMTIDQLNMTNNQTDYQARLIQIDDAEFISNELGQSFADGTNKITVNRNLEDCNGNTILVRTSGYANFANDALPSGKGTFIGIFGVFGSTPQLYVRTPSELTLNGARCGACFAQSSLAEDFSGMTSGQTVSSNCWSTQATVGTVQWIVNSMSGNLVAEGSILGTSDNSNELWLISPEMTFASSNVLSFQSAVQNWNHDGLSVYILTNYNGSVTAATQTNITSAVTLAGNGSGNNTLVSSGSVTISSYVSSGSYRVAFKYNASGSGGQTSTYKVDNVQITQ